MTHKELASLIDEIISSAKNNPSTGSLYRANLKDKILHSFLEQASKIDKYVEENDQLQRDVDDLQRILDDTNHTTEGLLRTVDDLENEVEYLENELERYKGE